ncbi:hypothetical protein [Burkholderia phage CSP3]|nr:hypothetical protein [Burkholderia phage CSP3]
MKPADHARILFAYLARLTPGDRAEIEQRLKDWDYASMNQPNVIQLAASARAAEACERAIENMTEHDRGLLREIVQRAAR